MPKFRKKPVVIEARQFTGTPESMYDITSWAHEGLHPASNAVVTRSEGGLRIRTLEDKEGVAAHYASPGDWIIKGVKGEFYPCKPDIFAATYEAAE